MLRQMAFTSMITVPVRYRDELVGALTLFMGRSGRRHTPQDVSFAAELANLAAPVVVNARLVEQHRQAEERCAPAKNACEWPRRRGRSASGTGTSCATI